MARVQIYCAGCGDRLRRTTVVLRGVVRADISSVEWRHTTRRWDNRYSPDSTTRPELLRAKAARHLNGGPRWSFA
jgi:hypothetical protein